MDNQRVIFNIQVYIFIVYKTKKEQDEYFTLQNNWALSTIYFYESIGVPMKILH